MRYVLRRAKESEKMLQLLYQQLDVICLLCQDKYIDSKLVKGWLYNKDYKSTEWNMEQYCYDLGLAHGIPGVLSILALLKINGIETAKSNSTLNNILEWLLEINSKYVKKSSWPFYIMPFSENDGLQNEYFARSAWCYGSPGIATTLMLVSKATKKITLNKFSNSFLKENLSNAKWNMTSPMICHGYSGLLTILNRMDESFVKSTFYEEATKTILGSIDTSKKYCFENKDFHRIIDTPGFLFGSCGIALSMLSIISLQTPKWDQVLLVN